MAEVRPGDALLHPVPLAAIGVLLLNDHVLKAAYPGFVTGKLSDVAGLVFFPLFLVSAFEVVEARFGARWRPKRAVLLAAVVATATVFALVQIWAPATWLYRFGLGALQWPFVAVAGGAFRPVVVMADPTDLVTVPAVLVAWWIGRRRTA
ncbi:MAG: hypothetical protein RMA76_22075 [Deltaproteobacteria bacterium]|jgi:hypothetical protein